MPKHQPLFTIRSKVWIVDEKGEVVFGLGRYRMLDTIQKTGSLNAAAKKLRMSYRAVWMRIRTSEQRLGKTLVERNGNGSCLTPFAHQLMTDFERLQNQVNDNSDANFEKTMFKSLK